MNSASTNLVKQLIGPENRWISTAIFSVRSSSSPGKDDWIEAWVAGNFFNESSKLNLCFLRKRRKWKMLSDTKRMLLFSPLRSLGLISNAYCYTLFHRSYISELRVELYRHLFHDGFWQRMVQTGKQLTISGWKNYQHIPSIYLHHLLFSPSSMNEIFRPVCEITFS